MTQRKLTIAFVAGETSGDILGAGLIHQIKQLHQNVDFVGIAGPNMIAEGCDAWFDMEELSVMGITEVLGRLPRILSIRKQLTKRIIDLKPDLFIGIDAPDFNLSLEGKIKQAGIKTVHYVSPSVWAWKQKRVFKIKKNTDLILTFLPFEKVFYDKYDVPCQFIGHKMADDIPLNPDKDKARNQLNLPLTAKILALLPGSRHSEVNLLSEPFLNAAAKIKTNYPDIEIIVPLTNQKRKHEFQTILQTMNLPFTVTMIDGNARDVLIASDVAILASGTVSLEAMLSKCPMVVGYKMKPFTYWLAKKLIKTPYISLPNILAKEPLVPELLQEQCTAEQLSYEALNLLNSDNKELKEHFLELHQTIRCDADKQAAKAVLNLLGINND